MKDYASICASVYLNKLINPSQYDSTTFSVYNRSMKMNSNANLPTKKDLRNFISDACIESITETLERERISNL